MIFSFSEEPIVIPCDQYLAEKHFEDYQTEDDLYPSLGEDNKDIVIVPYYEIQSGLRPHKYWGNLSNDETSLF